MSRIAVFFANGYEEIEALAVVDLCRRAGLEVDMISITGEKTTIGSHGIKIGMDMLFEEAAIENYDMLVLPGGLPGTKELENYAPLMQWLDRFYKEGKYIGAICAAPSIFGHRGFLKNRKACSYPTFENHLEGAEVTLRTVEISDHVVTSRGMGTAIDFGLAIVGIFCGENQKAELTDKIVYRR